MYEVNLRQYTAEGTINAFAQHLPRLQSMGIKVVWLMPIYPIAQQEKKGSLGSPYAIADYVNINPQLGSLEDLKALVAQAHSLEMYVILDWVANHTGWDHVWTKTHSEYYKRDTVTHNFKTASGMEDIIELDYDNPSLRQAMIAAMRYWVEEVNIDGFRCDLASWVPADFWYAARAELQKKKTLLWLGEYDPTENPDYNDIFDLAYTWQWMHRSEDYCHHRLDFDSLVAVAKSYLTVNTAPLWFTSNHDENSWNGTEYEKYGVYAKALAVLSYVFPGVPLVYSGQEIPNHKRLLFFDKDQLNWEQPLDLEHFYSQLNQLKRTHPALDYASDEYKFEIVYAKDGLLMLRSQNGETRLTSVFNFRYDSFCLPHEIFSAQPKQLFLGENIGWQPEGIQLEVGGYGLFVE